VPLTMLQIGQNHKNENHDASVVILGLSISPTFLLWLVLLARYLSYR
jgi:hypothetical protein